MQMNSLLEVRVRCDLGDTCGADFPFTYRKSATSAALLINNLNCRKEEMRKGKQLGKSRTSRTWGGPCNITLPIGKLEKAWCVTSANPHHSRTSNERSK